MVIWFWYAVNAGWLAFLELRMTNRSVIFKTFCSALAEDRDGHSCFQPATAQPEINRLCKYEIF
jgi:hypothetical protein